MYESKQGRSEMMIKQVRVDATNRPLIQRVLSDTSLAYLVCTGLGKDVVALHAMLQQTEAALRQVSQRFC
jgi:hypothetical protein